MNDPTIVLILLINLISQISKELNEHCIAKVIFLLHF